MAKSVKWIVDVLFLFLWGVVVFAVVRLLSARYFHERGRANAAALVGAAAFVIGGRTPFALTPSEPAAPAEQAAARSAPAGISMLQTQPLSACAGTIAVRPAGHGSVDAIRVVEGVELIDRGDRPAIGTQDGVVVTGWATNDQLDAPAAAVCPVLDGKLLGGADVRYGAQRTDIAQIFGHPSLVATGYEVRIPPAAFGTGRHMLGIAALAPHRAYASVVPGTRTIDVR